MILIFLIKQKTIILKLFKSINLFKKTKKNLRNEKRNHIYAYFEFSAKKMYLKYLFIFNPSDVTTQTFASAQFRT